MRQSGQRLRCRSKTAIAEVDFKPPERGTQAPEGLSRSAMIRTIIKRYLRERES